jgi:hypothetical protein
MLRSTSIAFTALTLLVSVFAPSVSALPRPVPALARRADSSTSDYQSVYYEWVPVKYDVCKNWDAYKGHNLVKADYPDLEKVDIFVCLVSFTDKTYRIGWFDPSVAFKCTLVFEGKSLEVTADYDSYYLSTLNDYKTKWATWDQLKDYGVDKIVYAPDHDCVPGQVCGTFKEKPNTYAPPDTSKGGKWYPSSRRRRSVSSPSVSPREIPASLSWTRTLGRRTDEYPPEYAAPQEYCYIGYGSSVTEYKAFYAYGGDAYMSDDVRYSTDVKVLVVDYYEDKEQSGGDDSQSDDSQGDDSQDDGSGDAQSKAWGTK